MLFFELRRKLKKAKNTILAIDTKNWASAEEAVEEMYENNTPHSCASQYYKKKL